MNAKEKTVYDGAIAEYGQDMVDFVMAVVLGQMAAGELKMKKASLPPTAILLTSFNKIATILTEAKGWTEEKLAACEHAMLVAAATSEEAKPEIVLPPGVTRIP